MILFPNLYKICQVICTVKSSPEKKLAAAEHCNSRSSPNFYSRSSVSSVDFRFNVISPSSSFSSSRFLFVLVLAAAHTYSGESELGRASERAALLETAFKENIIIIIILDLPPAFNDSPLSARWTKIFSPRERESRRGGATV